jgi:uncharacterized protein
MSDTVQHVPDRNRFELQEGKGSSGELAYLDYELGEGSVTFLHTVVPESMGGRGVGGRLAETAVGWAREQELDVVAECTFVQGWLAKHPEALAS